MKSRMLRVLVPVMGVAILAGCGEPAVSSPDALEVVFLPLAGAVEVASDVEPAVYFSSEVSEASLSPDSVFLMHAEMTCNTQDEQLACDCSGTWSKEQDAEAAISGGNGQVVKVVPDPGLADNRCYVMVCTTAVRGTTRGPLGDLGLPSDEKEALGLSKDLRIGAIQSFSTVYVEE